jgi:hypothetical protein
MCNFWHNLQLVEGGQYVVEVDKEVEVKWYSPCTSLWLAGVITIWPNTYICVHRKSVNFNHDDMIIFWQSIWNIQRQPMRLLSYIMIRFV